MTAERNYDELTPIIGKQLQALKAPPDTIAAFEALSRTIDMDGGLKEEIVEKIVGWIHSANKEKHEGSV